MHKCCWGKRRSERGREGKERVEPGGQSWSTVLWKAPFLKCVCMRGVGGGLPDKDQQRVSSVALLSDQLSEITNSRLSASQRSVNRR